MKVRFTEAAEDDLAAVLAYTAQNYPKIADRFESRIAHALERIAAWPESAPEITDRLGVRVINLLPYPYKIFYRVHAGAIEILHIHHSARAPRLSPD